MSFSEVARDVSDSILEDSSDSSGCDDDGGGDDAAADDDDATGDGGVTLPRPLSWDE